MEEREDEEDGDAPQLSAHALEALQGFYHEKDAHQKQFEEMKSRADDDFAEKSLSMEAFTEDWNASQFWYSDETASVLAQVLLEGATKHSSIAIVSAPSVYIQLRNLLLSVDKANRPSIALLEFDERFAVFKDFVQYDYAQPLKLPDAMKGRYDRIVIDPPFLSSDCQTKVALTVRYLASFWVAPPMPESTTDVGTTNENLDHTALNHPSQLLIVCTGERMESLILKLYGKVGVKTTEFVVKHAKGLSNEFRCFANCGWQVWNQAKEQS